MSIAASAPPIPGDDEFAGLAASDLDLVDFPSCVGALFAVQMLWHVFFSRLGRESSGPHAGGYR